MPLPSDRCTAVITFQARPRTVYDSDGAPAYQVLPVPVLDRRHCDMASFRQSPRFGGIANSSLFPAALAKLGRSLFPTGSIRLDRVPTGVEIDSSGFLARVTVRV